MNNIRISDLYDLSHTAAADYLSRFEYPWEALGGIKELIIELGKNLSSDEYDEVSENVYEFSVYSFDYLVICKRSVLGKRHFL